MTWLTKIASGPVFNNCTFNGPTSFGTGSGIDDFSKSSDQHSILLRNNSRYGSDTQRVWVLKTANLANTDVVFELRNERDGILSYSEFWHFKPDEEKAAKRTYDDLIKIGYSIKDFVEQDKIPIAIIAPMFKKALLKIAVSHKENSNILSFNHNIDDLKEDDWRNSLYGLRYPNHQEPTTVGNNSINYYEEKKSVKTKGSGRNKTFSY